MILSYSCFAIAWIGFFLNWAELTPLGRVLFAIIAVATITLVRDAHKARQKARRALYADSYCSGPDCFCSKPRGEEEAMEGMDEWLERARKRFPNTNPADLIGFSYDAGQPANPYGTITVGVANGKTPVELNGCTDPKTSSRKRDTFLSDFYEFCEENGYSQEERPLVFQEWVNG